jgi:hypothetical protein
MKTPIKSNHHLDEDGNPAGGITTGMGFAIVWQDGPLGRGEERIGPNGAFVETVLEAAKDRLEFYERTRFSCEENRRAIHHIDEALACLEIRTIQREERGVEGTHEV